MGKRKETLEIERKLYDMAIEKRWYGCEEVTIGFPHHRIPNQIVDYMLMDSKGTLYCYELKVTLQDLKSKAKLSFWGHYNYLVVSYDLYSKVSNWDEFVPNYVGIIVDFGSKLTSIHKAKKQELPSDVEVMLKESLIRSVHFKQIKYKDMADIEKIKNMSKRQRKLEKELKNMKDERNELYSDLQWIRRAYYKKTGMMVETEDIVKFIENTKMDS